MFKKAGLLHCMFVALLAVYGLLLFVPSTAKDSKNSNFYNKITTLRSFTAQSVPLWSVLKKPVIKNDHIRVRYMGGDCRHAPSSFSLTGIVPVYRHAIFSTDNSSFIFFRVQLLFKLRGPPQGFA